MLLSDQKLIICHFMRLMSYFALDIYLPRRKRKKSFTSGAAYGPYSVGRDDDMDGARWGATKKASQVNVTTVLVLIDIVYAFWILFTEMLIGFKSTE